MKKYLILSLIFIMFFLLQCSKSKNTSSSDNPIDEPICAAGTQSCTGQDLYQCNETGTSQTFLYTCSSDYFISECGQNASLEAACSCGDNWDCQAGQICNAGFCMNPDSQTDDTTPFLISASSPVIEWSWGGTGPSTLVTATYAANSPFQESAQVSTTPIVANLNDDNGDGKIDENDFPEIIFISYQGHSMTDNGVLRAIHGGGPDKGKDFFANCGGIEWHEGDSLPLTCTYADATLDSSAGLAVADLDYDGVPEIIAISETNSIIIYDNTGSIIITSSDFTFEGVNPQPSVANIDNDGLAEIIVGRTVVTLKKESGQLAFSDSFKGTKNTGASTLGSFVCVADIMNDSRLEIVAGGTAYSLPRPPAGAVTIADCVLFSPATPEEDSFCAGELITEWTSASDGYCAIADVLGTDQESAPSLSNTLDGIPEVIIVSLGHLLIFNSEDGTELRDITVDVGTQGGAPNIGDFDGDGFPEIGIAGATRYILTDLQDATASCPAWSLAADDNSTLPRTPPGVYCAEDSDCGDTAQFACNENINQCVCLHNSWLRLTEDDSAGRTGSSNYDFNSDGASEIVYNDECRFKIYDGLTGGLFLDTPSEHRNRVEYPVIVDVDNDGSAEIVLSASNESGFCNENFDTQYNNGIEVWGDANGLWKSARHIWNQYSYHITNVSENGQIPLFEPENWIEHNGIKYNSYRTNSNK